MIARSESLAQRLRQAAPDNATRLELAYSILFQRRPEPIEKQAGLLYLSEAEDNEKAWARYAQVLLGTHEFMHVE